MRKLSCVSILPPDVCNITPYFLVRHALHPLGYIMFFVLHLLCHMELYVFSKLMLLSNRANNSYGETDWHGQLTVCGVNPFAHIT